MAKIGVIGLGTMGANLALNMADRGTEIAVFNRTVSKVGAFVDSAGDLATRITGTESLEDLVAALETPRAILMMVPAGDAVDDQIAALTPLLDKGDLLIDGGNADFHDTRRRTKALEADRFGFLGLGVSGGSEGARHGPSLMAGGTAEAYAQVEAILEAIAADYDGSPCVAHLGPDGAGHFVKTVHNGIEYADMQIIAEIYGLMRDGMGRAPAEIAPVFARWNEGVLQSFLVEITGKVLEATDPDTGKPMVDVILDRAGQKGTGRWTVIEALKLGQSASAIEAAVAARGWSATKGAREHGATLMGGTEALELSEDTLESAMLAARIVAYGQGLGILAAASEEFGWDLDLARTAEIWRAGCIIRSALLDDISSAARDGLPEGLLIFAPAFAERLQGSVPALRKVVTAALTAGLPVPAMAAALGYLDTYRQARGTTDLIQAQRDLFGAHGFERVDADGAHHGPWG